MQGITPEWIVAGVAICTIIYHIGYSSQALAWLKENAATKKDIDILKAEQTNRQENLEHIEADVEAIKKEIGMIKVNCASRVAEFQAVREKI